MDTLVPFTEVFIIFKIVNCRWSMKLIRLNNLAAHTNFILSQTRFNRVRRRYQPTCKEISETTHGLRASLFKLITLPIKFGFSA